MSTTSERLKELMQVYDLTQSELARRLGLAKGTISQYVKGIRLPKQNILYHIGETFNVNEAWLMGFDVPMNKNEVSRQADKDFELLEKFNKLSDSQQKVILDMIDSLLGVNGD